MLSNLNEVVKSKSLCNDANEKMDNIEAIKLIKSLNGTKGAVGDVMGAAREEHLWAICISQFAVNHYRWYRSRYVW